MITSADTSVKMGCTWDYVFIESVVHGPQENILVRATGQSDT